MDRKASLDGTFPVEAEEVLNNSRSPSAKARTLGAELINAASFEITVAHNPTRVYSGQRKRSGVTVNLQNSTQ